MSDRIATPIDPTDPIFLSYRQSDGTAITTELTWLLRAAGIPVWRDVDDLPPGDTPTRLREAIADGLSGAALIITSEVSKSVIVKKLESVELIELHENASGFALAIVNDVTLESGGIDYRAPDRLLENIGAPLAGVDQHGTDRAGLLQTAKGLLWQRIAQQRARVSMENDVVTLSIQTRNTPQVYDRTGATLDIRVRPSIHDRLPSREGLIDLKDTLGFLPDAVTRSGAQTVLVTGGAHLSVALALGAALPATRVGSIEVRDQRGENWRSDTRPDTTDQYIATANRESSGTRASSPTEVAIYVDLVPGRSDDAFTRFLADMGNQLTAWEHLTSAQDQLLDPKHAGVVAYQVAERIRALSNTNGNALVHVLLRVPFPVAVLIGRLMNTLKLRAYEWDNSGRQGDPDSRPRFVPTMDLLPSSPQGVISGVLLPEDDSPSTKRLRWWSRLPGRL